MTRRHGALPRTLTIAADAVAAAAAFAAAYALRFHAGLIPVQGQIDELPTRYVEAAPVVVLAVLAAALWAGMYARARLARPAEVRDALRVAFGAGTFLAILALLHWKEFQYSRLMIGIGAALCAPLWMVGRHVSAHIVSSMRRSGRFRTRYALVGSGEHAARVRMTLADNPWLGLDLATRVPLDGPPEQEPDGPPSSTLDDLVAEIESGRVEEVYVALAAEHSARLPDVLRALTQVTANVRVLPDLGGAALLRPDATVLDGLALISIRERPLYGVGAMLKRGLDLLLATALLVLAAPLLLLLALLVKLSSRGPVLYRQERMGLDGVRFHMLKFRTMRPDAERESGPVFTRPGDARVTALGRWMRRLSLDELPQLWNVLRGDMSLVGPRPERPRFIEEFRNVFPGYMLRHSVRAGMTGWAQVHGLRGDTSLEERLRYDLEYIDRWSVLFDLEILGRTAIQVVVGRNAY